MSVTSLSEWSGLPVDVCYIGKLILLLPAYVIGWGVILFITAVIIEAACAFCRAVATGYLRRPSTVRPGLRIRKSFPAETPRDHP